MWSGEGRRRTVAEPAAPVAVPQRAPTEAEPAAPGQVSVLDMAGGQAEFSIEFAAPGPLGLLAGGAHG